jgi:hypothetical protein
VAALGRPKAVRDDIARQFTRGSKCVQPEEAIRLAAAEILETAIGNQADCYVVKVTASGSQGYVDYSSPEKGVYNSLSINVEVMHGFLE